MKTIKDYRHEVSLAIQKETGRSAKEIGEEVSDMVSSLYDHVVDEAIYLGVLDELRKIYKAATKAMLCDAAEDDPVDLLPCEIGELEAIFIDALRCRMDRSHYCTTKEARDGASMIAAERVRQIDAEGWSSVHDDDPIHYGDLAIAAAGLALDGTDIPISDEQSGANEDWNLIAKHGHQGEKPNRIRALTIAGALIAAEIDRLLRAEGKG